MTSKNELEGLVRELNNHVNKIREEILDISKDIDNIADDYCDVAGHWKAHEAASALRKLVGYDY